MSGWVWFIIGAFAGGVLGFLGAVVMAMPHVCELEDTISRLRDYIKELPTV